MLLQVQCIRQAMFQKSTRNFFKDLAWRSKFGFAIVLKKTSHLRSKAYSAISYRSPYCYCNFNVYVKPCFKSQLAIFSKTSLGGQSLDLPLFWRRPRTREARLIAQSALCIKRSPYCYCNSNVYVKPCFKSRLAIFSKTSLGGQSLDLPLFWRRPLTREARLTAQSATVVLITTATPMYTLSHVSKVNSQFFQRPRSQVKVWICHCFEEDLSLKKQGLQRNQLP